MTHGSGLGALHATIEAGGHTLISGLSQKLGGLDEGPNPHALLESSLVACTILTLQLYANRKQWIIASIDVDVRIDSETKEGTRMTRDIRLGGDVSSEQIERLTEIANKCPIHKLLTGSVEIATTVSHGESK